MRLQRWIGIGLCGVLLAGCAVTSRPPATPASGLDGAAEARMARADAWATGDRPLEAATELLAVVERYAGLEEAELAAQKLIAWRVEWSDDLGLRRDLIRYSEVLGEGEVVVAGWEALAELRRADIEGRTRALLGADRTEGGGRYERTRNWFGEMVDQGRSQVELFDLARSTGVPRTLVAEFYADDEASETGAVIPSGGDAGRIGLLVPLTGERAVMGEQAVRGARLAVQHDGGIELVVRDSGGDVYQGIRATKELILHEGVGAIVGPLLSEVAVGAGAVAEALSTTLITPTATHPRTPEIGAYVYQVNQPSETQAVRLAVYAKRGLLCRRVAMIYGNTSYGVTMAEAFQESFEAEGGVVVGREPFVPGDADFDSMVRRVKELRADGVFLPVSASDVEQIAPLLLYHDVHAALIGANGWDHPRVKELGDQYVGGAVHTAPFNAGSEDAATVALVDGFQAAFGELPGVVAAFTHDATRLLVHLYRDGARDRGDVWEALKGGCTIRGATGEIHFDAMGRSSGGADLVTLSRGRVYSIDEVGTRGTYVGELREALP